MRWKSQYFYYNGINHFNSVRNAKILNSYFYGVQNAVTNFGIGAYRAGSTPTFINVFSN